MLQSRPFSRLSHLNPRLPRPIGVFDSGVGGLTVLRALRERLPGEHFIYLGDTARLPYGTKSSQTIERYALQAARLLVQMDIQCLVVACNTASAVALDTLRAELAPVPVLGVVAPGADAGARMSRSGRIAVIATEGTVRGGAYEAAIKARRPAAQVIARACPLFVALAEEGLTHGPIVEAVAHRYLDELFFHPSNPAPDTLVLGCTHFPVLRDALSDLLGAGVAIVDSAQTTAEALAREFELGSLISSKAQTSSLRLLASDSPERFARVGGAFLGQSLSVADVELVDLTPATTLV